MLDCWMGYGASETFVRTLTEATGDLTTIKEKLARFRKTPSAKSATAVARVRSGEGRWAESIKYYREAQRLDPDSADLYAAPILENQFAGYMRHRLTPSDLESTADSVLAGHQRGALELVGTAQVMAAISRREKSPKLAAPYLRAAIEATSASKDSSLLQARKQLEAFEALHILGDKPRAFALKKEALPEGWETSASELNNFAWWCFENDVQLEEAETLARKAVELAAPGKEKAMILDTLAEICNKRGNCREALTWITQATKESPEDKHYQEQKARFETLLAKQKS